MDSSMVVTIALQVIALIGAIAVYVVMLWIGYDVLEAWKKLLNKLLKEWRGE